MSYVTDADIEARVGHPAFVQLADDDGDGVADPAVVEETRRGAEGEADSYLARRCAVPVDLVAHPELADLLKTIVLDLVEYRLHARRPPVPDVVTTKRKAAVEWLAKLASGQVELPAGSPVSGKRTSVFAAASTGNPRVLSRKELEGF